MNLVLLALFLLQSKHFLGDFVLQSRRHVAGKASYGALAGVEHAAIHAVLTVLCLVAVGVAPLPVALAAIAELAVHYHLDWVKERVSRSGHFTPADQGYWVLLGGDQFAHQLTYLTMLWILL